MDLDHSAYKSPKIADSHILPSNSSILRLQRSAAERLGLLEAKATNASVSAAHDKMPVAKQQIGSIVQLERTLKTLNAPAGKSTALKPIKLVTDVAGFRHFPEKQKQTGLDNKRQTDAGSINCENNVISGDCKPQRSCPTDSGVLRRAGKDLKNTSNSLADQLMLTKESMTRQRFVLGTRSDGIKVMKSDHDYLSLENRPQDTGDVVTNRLKSDSSQSTNVKLEEPPAVRHLTPIVTQHESSPQRTETEGEILKAKLNKVSEELMQCRKQLQEKEAHVQRVIIAEQFTAKLLKSAWERNVRVEEELRQYTEMTLSRKRRLPTNDLSSSDKIRDHSSASQNAAPQVGIKSDSCPAKKLKSYLAFLSTNEDNATIANTLVKFLQENVGVRKKVGALLKNESKLADENNVGVYNGLSNGQWNGDVL